MPIELESLYRERLHFHISVEGMVVLDWIKIISAKDFHHCRAFRAVVINRKSRLREIHSLRDCPLLESIELRASVEVIGRNVLARSAIGQYTFVHSGFIISMNEICFRGNRRQCRVFLQWRVDAESIDSCGYFDGYSSENEDWNHALIKNPRLM
jgi:hypothetical protein